MLLCEFCATHFTTKGSLNKHLRRIHHLNLKVPNIIDKKIFKCPQEGCNRSFTCRTSLPRHVRQCHSTRELVPLKKRKSINDGAKSNISKPISCSVEDVKAVLPINYNYVISKKNDAYKIEFEVRCVITCHKWLKEFEEANKLSCRKGLVRKLKNSDQVVLNLKYLCGFNVKRIPSQLKSTNFRKKQFNCPWSLRSYGRLLQNGNVKMIVYLKGVHNHDINCAAALLERKPLLEIKEKFLMLFEAKLSASAAYFKHISDLKNEYGDDYYLVQGDSGICPKKKWVYNLYYSVFIKKYGANYGPEMIKILQNNIEIYNAQCNSRCAAFKQVGNNYIVAIATPHMKRILGKIPQTAEMLFVDSTAVEMSGVKLFILLTSSFAGGLPVGLIFVTSESTDVLTTGFYEYKKLISAIGFYGKESPALIMMDDSTAERNALHSVFPTAKLLLCIFHLLQNIWKHLWDQKSGIQNNDCRSLFVATKRILYATSQADMESLYEEFFAASQDYPMFQKYIQNLYTRREEWALCMQQKLITHSKNTNNISEAVMQIVKERVLDWKKAHSPVHLFSICVTEFIDYYVDKLIAIANGQSHFHVQAKFLKFEKVINTLELVSSDESIGLFDVLNLKSKEMYTVDINSGNCTCYVGINGNICKHAFFVQENTKLENHHPLLGSTYEAEKKIVFFIATGRNDVEDGWFAPLLVNAEFEQDPSLLIEDIYENVEDAVQELLPEDVMNDDVDEIPLSMEQMINLSDTWKDYETRFTDVIKCRSKDDPRILEGVALLINNFEKCNTTESFVAACATFGKFSSQLPHNKILHTEK